MNNTGKNWSGYRGEALTAFATSCPKFEPQEQKDFAVHLEQHGTAEDFAAWAAADPSFWSRYNALGLFAHCPTVSSPVLIQTLKNSLDSDLHKATVYELLLLKPESAPLVQNVLPHINYSLFSSSDLSHLLYYMMGARFCDVLDTHWSVFKPIIEQRLQQNIVDAARVGWDLRSKIEVTPSNPSKYFEACCEGNLLHRIQELAGTPIKTASITRGFYKAAKNNHENVVRHVWDTYPNTPWHGDQKSTSVLTAVPYVSWEIAQKILDHCLHHDPEQLSEIRDTLLHLAIGQKNTPLFAFLEPYAYNTELYPLYKEAVVCEFEEAVVMLLRRPDSHSLFHLVLNDFRNDYLNWTPQIQWAESVYSHHQKGVLSAEISHVPSTPSALRKI